MNTTNQATTTPAVDPADGFPNLPESLRRFPVTAQSTPPAPPPVTRGGTTTTLKMIKEAAMAKTSAPSKLDQLRALREASYADAEKRSAEAKATPHRAMDEAGRNPAALAARDRVKAEQKAKASAEPKRKPLTFKDGVAKAKHAHYSVALDDSGEHRMFIVTATNAEGVARVGEFDQADAARNAAADHHFGLASNGAPIYKPTPEKKESTVSAKKKPKAKAKKASKAKATSKRPAKAKAAKAVKAKATAAARKPVKGKTSAKAPAKAPAVGKGADLIARMQKGWVSAKAVCEEFGWLPHTLRGFLSRTRESHNVEAERREDGTYYRIK